MRAESRVWYARARGSVRASENNSALCINRIIAGMHAREEREAARLMSSRDDDDDDD